MLLLVALPCDSLIVRCVFCSALCHFGMFSEAACILDTSPVGDVALNSNLFTSEEKGCCIWPQPQLTPLGHHTPCNVNEALTLLILREMIILGVRGLFCSFPTSPQVGPSFESSLASTSHTFLALLASRAHCVHRALHCVLFCTQSYLTWGPGPSLTRGDERQRDVQRLAWQLPQQGARLSA